MKTLIAALLALSISSLAHAKTAQNCAFGTSTADLSDRLEETAKGKALYKVEHLDLHRQVRLQGLTPNERKMIVLAMGQTAMGNQASEQELLEAFSKADGYITYFQHNSNGAEFAEVASFPGDNEFGLIFKVKELHRNGDYTIDSVAAVITDSDIEDCMVEYEKP